MLTIVDGRGVGQMLTKADKGGLKKLNSADMICGQPLIRCEGWRNY